MTNSKIPIKNGYLLPPIFILLTSTICISGGIIVLNAFTSIFDSQIDFIFELTIGLLLLIVGIGVCTSQHGIILNTEFNLCKRYWQFFGIKVGSWQTMSNYTSLALTSSTIQINSQSKFNTEAPLESNSFEIVLIDEEKYDLLNIQKLNSLKEAQQQIQKLSSHLNLPIISIQ